MTGTIPSGIPPVPDGPGLWMTSRTIRSATAPCANELDLTLDLSCHDASYETVAEALKRAADRPSPQPELEIPPEVEAEILQEIQDRHYHAWLGEPVPALHGRTPREAAQSKTLRPLLRDLLRELDNHAERARTEGRFAYDSAWLWSALGLRRPPLRP